MAAMEYPYFLNINGIYTIPQRDYSCIVSMLLGPHSYFCLDNGAKLEFDNSSLELLRRHPVSPVFRITSRCAPRDYVKWPTNDLWKCILEGVKFVNFHGIWERELLVHLVANMPKLEIVSFTYAYSNQLADTINAIASPALHQLHLHVPVGQKWSVVNAIQKMESRGITLQKLLLVFGDQFAYHEFAELMPDVKEYLGPYSSLQKSVLAEDAEVILLHGGEYSKEKGAVCVGTLLKHGYEKDGNIEMAENKYTTTDRDEDKCYEKYKVFRKMVGSRSIRQGSLLGDWVESRQDVSIPHRGVPGNDPDFHCYRNVESLAHVLPCYDPMPFGTREAQARMTDYYWRNNRVGGGTCCEYNPDSPDDFKKWRIPGFEKTRIQIVIYHAGLTEYVTSNGFFFRLPSMNHEADFYDYIVCSRRIIFYCVHHFRLYVVPTNMNKFLRNGIHVEFTGDWANAPVRAIGHRFSGKAFKKLTVVAWCNRGQIIRQLVQNSLKHSAKRSLSHIHLDARDVEDCSVGSALNGIHSTIAEMQEVLVIGTTWNTGQYQCRLSVLKTDMETILVPGGTCTVVCMQPMDARHACDAHTLRMNGFVHLPFPVLVHPPFTSPDPAREDPPCRWYTLMMGFYAFHNNRHFYVVLPWDETKLGYSKSREWEKTIACGPSSL